MRVVKVGGRAQGDPRLPFALAAMANDTICVASTTESGKAAQPAVHANSGSLCIVHGGGDEVSTMQRRLGLEPVFSGGRRVTSAEDLEVVRMVLSGMINKRLVSRLLLRGVLAVGVSGEDALLFSAHATAQKEMGRVGGAVSVDPALVHHLLRGGFVPVVSPLARDADDANGAGLNVNGDDAAAALAVAIKADELVLLVDVPGVLDNGMPVAFLDLSAAASLIANGVAAGGMAAKLEAAAVAVRGGVANVRIVGLDGFGDPESGTRIVL